MTIVKQYLSSRAFFFLAISTTLYLQEELEKEKDAKKAETARYEKEMEASARLQAAEKDRKTAARQKELERSAKVEKGRKETQRLLAKQQAEIDKKNVRRTDQCTSCLLCIHMEHFVTGLQLNYHDVFTDTAIHSDRLLWITLHCVKHWTHNFHIH